MKVERIQCDLCKKTFLAEHCGIGKFHNIDNVQGYEDVHICKECASSWGLAYAGKVLFGNQLQCPECKVVSNLCTNLMRILDGGIEPVYQKCDNCDAFTVLVNQDGKYLLVGQEEFKSG